MFQILLVVIVNLKTLMFPLLTAAAVVIQYYEDLEILKLLVRLAGNIRVHASVGGSNVYGLWNTEPGGAADLPKFKIQC